MEAGRPFVGPSGARLAEWWELVGLARGDFYITNVLDYQPKDIERVPRDEMEWAFARLHERLARLEDPWLIVPVGNYALYALAGKGRVSWHSKDGRLSRPGITKWRGSLLSYVDQRGRTVKVVPAIHPAATFPRGKMAGKQSEQFHWVSVEWDWPRIAEEAKTREIVLPTREHVTAPTLQEAVDFLGSIAPGQRVAVDIETPRPNKKTKLSIGCVGFAVSPTLSLTVPTTTHYWGTEKSAVTAALRSALQRADVIMHNGLSFDAYILAREGFPVRNYTSDTRAKHFTVWPRLPHDLAFVGTTLTRQPYWKDEAKDPDEIVRFAKNDEALWHYNGIDCCVTFECDDRLNEELTRLGLWDTYERRHARLIAPLLAASLNGLRIDETRRATRLAAAQEASAQRNSEMTHAAGGPLVSKTGLSTHAVRFALYGAKGLPEKKREENVEKLVALGIKPLLLPVQYKRSPRGKETRTVSVDEETIRRLAIRFPSEAGPLCEAVLGFQRASSLRKQLAGGKCDADGRMRCTFNFVSTRLSSSANPYETGDNLQNRDRELRDIFVPDEGCVFLKMDMSQIESRILFMLSRDPKLIEIARAAPWDLDVHTRNAAIIFKVSEKDVTKEQRMLGKTTSYLVQRGGAAKKLQETLLLQGVVRSVEECGRFIRNYKNAYPGLDDYFRDVRQVMMRQRALVSTWGDVVTFPYARLDDDVYGFGYSWAPQIEAGGIVNNFGVLPYGNDPAPYTKMHLQVHDELLWSVSPAIAYDFARWMQEKVERPRVYYGEAMTVPVTFALGTSWACEKEWKRLPKREEFGL
jgi:uracil-DNA glycosylase family 4